MDFGDEWKIRKKQVRGAREPASGVPRGAINLATEAFVYYSSETTDHPIEHALDAYGGPGGTRWEAAEADEPQFIEVEFDQSQPVARMTFEAEEREAERTQEVAVEVSTDGGESYRQVLAQEFNFSPRGATFQREDWRLNLEGVTNLRLSIVPNKRGSGRATITSLHFYPE